MKRVAVLIAALLSVVVLSGVATGCASAPARATDTALTTRNAPAASARTVVVNCLFKQQSRPSSFILTCADANDVLAHLHWVSWGSGAAFATGIEQINDCIPNCAAGKFVNYPGTFYFSRVTRVYTANRPPLYYCNGTHTCYPQTATFDLWT